MVVLANGIFIHMHVHCLDCFPFGLPNCTPSARFLAKASFYSLCRTVQSQIAGSRLSACRNLLFVFAV